MLRKYAALTVETQHAVYSITFPYLLETNLSKST